MSVFEPLLANTLRVLDSYGLDAEALFSEQGIQFKLPLDPAVRISRGKYLELRRRSAVLSGDPYFALRAAELLHPGDLGVLGFAWLSSQNLRECFLRLERYVGIISENASVSLVDQPPDLLVFYETDPGLDPEPLTSITPGAVMLRMAQMHRQKPFRLTEARFACGKPKHTAGFRRFFDCPISFGNDRNQLRIALHFTDEAIPHSNDALARLHDEIMDKYLLELKRPDIVGKVRAEIMRQLPAGGVTVETVSPFLGQSSRTLRRRLQEANITFKQLVTQVRKELSAQLISDHSLSLSEISFMLGFSESSAFSRAYKSWFGVSPKLARARSVRQHN